MKDEALLSSVVYEHVRKLSSLPCEYEMLPASREKLPCASVQTLTGDPIEKRYKSGGYIGRYRFAIYLRQQTKDTKSRINSGQVLTDLAVTIDESRVELPDSFSFLGIELDTLPVKVDVDEAYDDWQAVFTLRYKKG